MLDYSTSQLERDEDFSDPDYLPASYRGSGMPDELSPAGQQMILQCQQGPVEIPPEAPAMSRSDVKAILAEEHPGIPFNLDEWHSEYVGIDNRFLRDTHRCQIRRCLSEEKWEGADWPEALQRMHFHYSSIAAAQAKAEECQRIGRAASLPLATMLEQDVPA